MKVLLEIEDKRADAFMEVLQNINFVKVKRVGTKKEKLLKELEEAVNEMNLIKSGKKQGRDARELLKELQGNND